MPATALTPLPHRWLWRDLSHQSPTSASASLRLPPMQCTNENTGAPRAGCSAFKALKEQFDDSYFGNRAPTQILIHTPYLQRK